MTQHGVISMVDKNIYKSGISMELVFLRKTKSDADRKYKNLEDLYEKQMVINFVIFRVYPTLYIHVRNNKAALHLAIINL